MKEHILYLSIAAFLVISGTAYSQVMPDRSPSRGRYNAPAEVEAKIKSADPLNDILLIDTNAELVETADDPIGDADLVPEEASPDDASTDAGEEIVGQEAVAATEVDNVPQPDDTLISNQENGM